MKVTRLMEIVREIINEELQFESQASDDAKRQGLEYMGFGRYGKDGKVTHTSKGGKLTPVPTKQSAGQTTQKKPSLDKDGWEDWGGGLAYHPGDPKTPSKEKDDWEDWGGGLAYHPGGEKSKTKSPTPSDQPAAAAKELPPEEQGDMEIDGMTFDKQGIKRENPKLWQRYLDARKIAGTDVYMKSGQFYKQRPAIDRLDGVPSPIKMST